MAEIDNNLKPRTIPDALELSERKYKAIYETVEESVTEMSTIDALLSLKSTFPDTNEMIAAIYMFSVKVGAAKAAAKQEEIGEEAFVKGQMVGVITNIPVILQQLEERGIITVNDPSKVKSMKNMRSNDTGIPDDILYGMSRSENPMRGSRNVELKNKPEKKPKTEEPKTDDKPPKDEKSDPAYG